LHRVLTRIVCSKRLRENVYMASDAGQSTMQIFGAFGSMFGAIQHDGYEAYCRGCAEYGLSAVGCWPHVRRKFDEAIKAQGLLGPEKRKVSLAGVAMAKIQHLYRIERETKALAPE